MAKNETTKKPGWLNKSEMAKSLGISPQAFDKWGVEPIARVGREAFYRVQDVVQNRVENASRKQQPDGVSADGIDPLAEAKLTQERLRLTTAQADSQEKKNKVADRELVPVGFMAHALGRVTAKIAAKLETIGKTVKREHPDIDPVVIETIEREIAVSRNSAAELAEDTPELLDEFFDDMAASPKQAD